MAVDKVGDMSMQELKARIEAVIRRKFPFIPKPQDERSMEEILEDIDRHMFTPPQGTKFTLELLREDRDS